MDSITNTQATKNTFTRKDLKARALEGQMEGVFLVRKAITVLLDSLEYQGCTAYEAFSDVLSEIGALTREIENKNKAV